MDFQQGGIAYWAAIIGLVITAAFTAYWLAGKRANRKLEKFRSLDEAIKFSQNRLKVLESKVSDASEKLSELDQETKDLQNLKKNADSIASQLDSNKEQVDAVKQEIELKKSKITELDKTIHDLMAKADIYSRIDEFVEHGHFEMPEYLYETSERFAEEIRKVRERQKELIKEKRALQIPEAENAKDRRLLNGQAKLILTSFNIECDLLIGKVNPGNFPRILERIEKKANTLEKSAADLHLGINNSYVEFKFEECKLQYQYKLKKKEEQEEQRLIRQQMREEQKAIREYEKAMAEAEKEEQIYRDLLERARSQLHESSEEDRIAVEQRIADLERQLAEAEEKEARAKSMAEQTRRGHVYVISNIGSFGDGVYKIGLTRRLEPQDRVKELGDASVPFPFDVHAMIYSEDAPALEAALHREFSDRRINAVNWRKEFFQVSLAEVKDAVYRLAGDEADLKTTIMAEEFYETLRLQRSRSHSGGSEAASAH